MKNLFDFKNIFSKFNSNQTYSEIIIQFLARLLILYLPLVILFAILESFVKSRLLFNYFYLVIVSLHLAALSTLYRFISTIYKKLFPTKIRILALVEEEKQSDASKAGATYIGLDKYIKLIENNWFNFDVIVTTPSSYKKLTQITDVLSKRGLMPDIKNGNVTNDIFGTISIIKNENWPEGKTEIDSDFLRKLLLNK